jgi:hypothetical protein
VTIETVVVVEEGRLFRAADVAVGVGDLPVVARSSCRGQVERRLVWGLEREDSADGSARLELGFAGSAAAVGEDLVAEAHPLDVGGAFGRGVEDEAIREGGLDDAVGDGGGRLGLRWSSKEQGASGKEG